MSGDSAHTATNGQRWDMQDDLSAVDQEMYEIIRKEKERQRRGDLLHTSSILLDVSIL